MWTRRWTCYSSWVRPILVFHDQRKFLRRMTDINHHYAQKLFNIKVRLHGCGKLCCDAALCLGSAPPRIPFGNSREFVFFELGLRFREQHWPVSSCPTVCCMKLSNNLLGLEVSLTDSNLFSITVSITYGNTSLLIALFPIPMWNSYQLPQ